MWLREGTMRRILLNCVALIAAAANVALAGGQMMPGGQNQVTGAPPLAGQHEQEPVTPSEEKPDVAAKKAFNAAMKALNKAKEFEAIAAAAPDADRRGNALEKMNDRYNKALDLFTEALSNKGDMVDAWDNVGYVHLRLGAYAEAVDDYNHVLARKPELLEAVAHRAEANLALDRLDDVKIAYMDLFNRAPNLADQLMLAMHKWLADHRDDSHGMRPADVAAFDKWLKERDTVAQQSAAPPH
jgi:tetratricopeptide (TPR) repeat protein